MTREDLYEMWAPARSVWSAWAKPVLFAAFDVSTLSPAAAPVLGPPPGTLNPAGDTFVLAPPAGAPTDTFGLAPPPLVSAAPLSVSAAPEEPAGPADVSWSPDPAGETAVIVDLPGKRSVTIGLALARRGYRPVPVFNGNDGPGALIELGPLREAIAAGAAELTSLGLVDDASPAFLVDSRRAGKGLVASPGKFDNRWLVFPQDFPSGNLLRSRGIRRAIVCQLGTEIPDDLKHILLRWQEAGITISVRDDHVGTALMEVTVAKPGMFRSFLYRLSAIMGFKRNSAGGFGSTIPHPSSGGGGGYRGGFS